MDGRQNGGCDGLGSAWDVLVDSLDASDREMQVEVVGESVFVPQENVKPLEKSENGLDGPVKT